MEIEKIEKILQATIINNLKNEGYIKDLIKITYNNGDYVYLDVKAGADITKINYYNIKESSMIKTLYKKLDYRKLKGVML